MVEVKDNEESREEKQDKMETRLKRTRLANKMYHHGHSLIVCLLLRLLYDNEICIPIHVYYSTDGR